MRALDLVEAGPAHRGNERALVVTDLAAEPEVEMSFYDHRRGRFIGEGAPTAQPHFFRAARLELKDGRMGYAVGPEVTRYLRTGALIGIATRAAGSLGDVPSKVRPFESAAAKADVAVKTADEETAVSAPLPPAPVWPASGAKLSPAPKLPSVQTPHAAAPVVKSEPPRRRWGRLAAALLLTAVAAMLAVPAVLADLGWYDPVVNIKDSLDFVQQRSAADDLIVFQPLKATILIRYPWWVRPFAGWLVPDRPPGELAPIQSFWLRTTGGERVMEHAVSLTVNPSPVQLKQGQVLHATLTFRNTTIGAVFDTREATLRQAPLPHGGLEVDSPGPLVFNGQQGGPFSPAHIVVNLKAVGAGFVWVTAPLPSGGWLGVSDHEGTLSDDGSASVTLFPADAARNLAPSSYDQTLTFEDKVAGKTVAKTVRLIVNARPQPQLTVDAPQTEFRGLTGGPWTPASVPMTLSVAGADVALSVATPDWIESLGSQKIPQGQSVTLTVRPSAAATQLGPATYDGEIAFRNDGKLLSHQPFRLTVLDPALECDRLMGTRFEADRPAGNAFLQGSTARLSDADLDAANRACSLASAHDQSVRARRFLTQRGRALATMAVRLTETNDDSAATVMNDARFLWERAAERGSISAMNLLGYYWDGGFDNEALGELPDVPNDKCTLTQPPTRAFTTQDTQKAYDWWLKAANATPPDPTAMNSLGFLLTNADETCPPAAGLTSRFSEGVAWLERAFNMGYARAGEALGEWYIIGHDNARYPADDFDKNLDAGLAWMEKACSGTGPEGVALHRAKVFFGRTRVMHTIVAGGRTKPASCS